MHRRESYQRSASLAPRRGAGFVAQLGSRGTYPCRGARTTGARRRGHGPPPEGEINMRKTLPLCTALLLGLLGLLAGGAALAQAPASSLPAELPADITAPQIQPATTPLLQPLQA